MPFTNIILPNAMDTSNLSATACVFVTVDLANFSLAFRHTRSLYDRLHTHDAPDPDPPAGKDLEVFIAKILLFLKPDPPLITIESYKDTLPHRRFWHAICAISVFSQLMLRSRPKENSGHEQSYDTLCTVLRNHWATLWKWVVCGVRRAWHLDRFPLLDYHTRFLLTTLHKFMNNLLETDAKYGLRKSLFTDGSEAFLDLWYLHAKHPELDQLVEVSPDSLVNEWFVYGDGSWLRFLSYGDSAGQLANFVLRRARKLFQTKQNFLVNKPQHLLHHVCLLTCAAVTPAIQEHFIVAGAITLYTRMLVRVSEGFGPNDKEPVLRRHLAEELCILLKTCFEQMQGITWLRRSLETGLLVGIVQCAPRIPEDGRVPMLTELVNTLSRYLVYVSILRPLIRFLNKREVMQTHSLMLKSGPFCPIFTRMRFVARLRAERFGSRMIRTCNSSQCGLKDLDQNFKRCSGCEEVVYCSMECQRRDWTDSGHRSYCKEKSRDIRGSEYDLSREEHESAMLLLLEDLMRNGLITTSPANFDRKKYQTFRHPKILSDHTFFPPNMTITEGDDGEADHLTFACRIPYGNNSRLAFITRPLNKWPLTDPSDLIYHIKQS